MDIKNNLILALDVMSESEAIDICRSVAEHIDTIKIGYPLALAEGLEIIGKIKDEFVNSLSEEDKPEFFVIFSQTQKYVKRHLKPEQMQ